MTSCTRFALVALCGVASLALTGGCPASGTSGTNNNGTPTLTGGEQQSVEAGLSSIESLVNATNTTQTTIGDDSQARSTPLAFRRSGRVRP